LINVFIQCEVLVLTIKLAVDNLKFSLAQQKNCITVEMLVLPCRSEKANIYMT